MLMESDFSKLKMDYAQEVKLSLFICDEDTTRERERERSHH